MHEHTATDVLTKLFDLLNWEDVACTCMLVILYKDARLETVMGAIVSLSIILSAYVMQKMGKT